MRNGEKKRKKKELRNYKAVCDIHFKTIGMDNSILVFFNHMVLIYSNRRLYFEGILQGFLQKLYKILRNSLHLFPHKVSTMHQLNDTYNAAHNFCNWFVSWRTLCQESSHHCEWHPLSREPEKIFVWLPRNTNTYRCSVTNLHSRIYTGVFLRFELNWHNYIFCWTLYIIMNLL